MGHGREELVRIVLPHWGLVVLAGPAGSGKSTLARRIVPPTGIVSSDDLRGVVCDDPGNQDPWVAARAFDLLYRVLDARLAWAARQVRRGARGPFLTVADTTALQRSSRQRLLQIARAHGAPATLVLLDLPLEVCLARAAQREAEERQLARSTPHAPHPAVPSSPAPPLPQLRERGPGGEGAKWGPAVRVRAVPPEVIAYQWRRFQEGTRHVEQEGFDRVWRLDGAEPVEIEIEESPAPPAVALAVAEPPTAIPPVELRGIYAAALTRVLLDQGAPIVAPSAELAGRLAVSAHPGPAVVVVDDTTDRLGVVLTGPPPAPEQLAQLLLALVPGALRGRAPGGVPTVLFSGAARAWLDEQRRRVVPTVVGHHRLCVAQVPGLGAVEAALDGSLEAARAAGAALLRPLLARSFAPGSVVRVYHDKPWRRPIVATAVVVRYEDPATLSPDRPSRAAPRLLLRRTFRPGGAYDGLDLPRCEGDWGTIEVADGAAVLHRAYYRADGTLLGELFNVGTPAEFSPGNVRYVDLEVDVVRRPDGRVEVVDEADLEAAVRSGAVPAPLAAAAGALAERLAERLRAGADWREVER
jgi:predicted kinase